MMLICCFFCLWGQWGKTQTTLHCHFNPHSGRKVGLQLEWQMQRCVFVLFILSVNLRSCNIELTCTSLSDGTSNFTSDNPTIKWWQIYLSVCIHLYSHPFLNKQVLTHFATKQICLACFNFWQSLLQVFGRHKAHIPWSLHVVALHISLGMD